MPIAFSATGMRSSVTVPNMSPSLAVSGCAAAMRTQPAGTLGSTTTGSVASPPSCAMRTQSPSPTPSLSASAADMRAARRRGVACHLQRLGAACKRVGEIDRDLGDALDSRRNRWHWRDGGGQVRQPRSQVEPLQRLCLDLVSAAELEARDAEQVPQHTQNLPARPRFQERPHHAREALHAAFGAHERAGRLGERSDGQEHVGVLDGAVAERRHRDHEVGRVHRRQRLARIVAVELDFGVPEQIGAARLREHRRVRSCPGGSPAGAAPGEVATHAVGRFPQKAQARTGDLRQFVGEPMQSGSLRMVLSEIAQEQRDVGVSCTGFRRSSRADRAMRARRRALRAASRDCHALHLCSGADQLRQLPPPSRRARRRLSHGA